MFKLKRPCENCPFKKGMGSKFRLDPSRLVEIFQATAFQCHKTVDYDADDGEPRKGKKPQQCAGLMALLVAEKRWNAIMTVGQRLGHFDPAQLDTSETYASFGDAFNAHAGDEDL